MIRRGSDPQRSANQKPIAKDNDIKTKSTANLPRLWPVRLKPQDDEVTSSWVARVLSANGLSALDFAKVVGLPTLALRDFDTHLDARLSDLFAANTGITAAQLAATQLSHYAGVLWETAARQHHPAWILWRDAWERQTKFYLQFCPDCLRHDERPYFRRWWRLSLAVSCPFHNRFLLDRCPQCSSGVNLLASRAGITRRDGRTMVRCRCCNHLLTGEIPDESIDRNAKALHSYQAVLYDRINAGETVLAPGTPPIRTLLYLPALRHLINLIAGRADTKSFGRVVRTTCGLPPASNDQVSATFDGLDNRARRERLFAASWLLEEWPERFVAVCNDAKLRASAFRSVKPNWFHQVVRERLLVKHERWRKLQPVKFRIKADFVRKYAGTSAVGFSRFVERVAFVRARLDLWDDVLALGRELQKEGLYSTKGLSTRRLIDKTNRILQVAQCDAPLEQQWVDIFGRNKNNDFAAFAKRLRFVRARRTLWDDPSALYSALYKAGLYASSTVNPGKALRLVELARQDKGPKELFLIHCGAAASREKARRGAAEILVETLSTNGASDLGTT